MNRTKLKSYAPQARRDFIQAMTDRAAFYGLTADKIEPVVERGDVAVIGGREFPRIIATKRKALEDRIKKHGTDWSKAFAQIMEALAYTWFNRMVAIRFMELHGYLDHGYRVLSHPDGKPTPEILEHAEHVDLAGLKKDLVIDLKLAGNKETELYRLLLTSQCNALHAAMPFLFEKIDDETELLLPDNLLNSDSLMRKLVNEIDENDWKEVEIIGWLYQFYISEKKDEVIGKVVASEDIPAATQLFTPNWIVKYLVQNTLGRQWMATYPQSPLRQKMGYYIEPAEQTPEVQEQLKAITPTSLNPEELTLLDPACGSGHILVEAYDLFKEIYQERGYRAKDIPALILKKNLFGLEIDDRAAQLAAFALMMKARADDRRIFESEAKPNVVAFQDSFGMDAEEIHYALTSPLKNEKVQPEPPAPAGLLFETEDNLFTRAASSVAKIAISSPSANYSKADIAALLELFENAKTFGSLSQVPRNLAAKLPEIEKRLDDVLIYGDLTHASAHVLKPLLQQARLLAKQYDSVVANPPYMGDRAINNVLKEYVASHFQDSKADLFACFIERGNYFLNDYCFSSFVTMESWLFLSSFELLRKQLLLSSQIDSLVHIGFNSFPSLNSKVVRAVAFSLRKRKVLNYAGVYIDLNSAAQSADKEVVFLRRASSIEHNVRQEDFESIPGSPIAYWLTQKARAAFQRGTLLGDVCAPRLGMTTGDNNRYLRLWWEVDSSRIGFGMRSRDEALLSKRKWFPYNKGGPFRKWYGNNEYVVDWENDGAKIITSGKAYPRAKEMYFQSGITWTFVSSSGFGVRKANSGFIFDVAGSSAFPSTEDLGIVLAFLCSRISSEFLRAINPTLNFQAGNVSALPLLRCSDSVTNEIKEIADNAVRIATDDWDSSELSWEFVTFCITTQTKPTIKDSLSSAIAVLEVRFQQLKYLEEKNNRIFIEAYGLQNELSPDVPDEQITLYRPDREEDIKRLLSYAIGCIMGRYSLDKPGLIYAHSGNQGFDASQYKGFQADEDGIIPLLESDWGIEDDATNRFVEFIGVAWPKEHLEENLKFVAESLGANSNEQPRDTIRRYLSNGFYKHHLSMYKKRPIYWLFSSGKLRAFQCLVYLHRYNDGTLARMRTEYVIPLQGQIAARIEQLEGDKAQATSTSHRKKLQKEQDDLKKQQTELRIFEEKLKHAADMKISLDLDDGVKVNYGKFGDLLAEVKAITGGKEEE